MLNSISDVTLIRLPHHFEDNGNLVVIEGGAHVPFAIARVFVVWAPAGAIRGQHAHKACAQFLTCTAGRVEVLCDDGFKSVRYMLEPPDVGLLIPSGIWSQQTYQAPATVLTVLCDQPYDALDYIRDYGEFTAYRQADGLARFSRENR